MIPNVVLLQGWKDFFFHLRASSIDVEMDSTKMDLLLFCDPMYTTVPFSPSGLHLQTYKNRKKPGTSGFAMKTWSAPLFISLEVQGPEEGSPDPLRLPLEAGEWGKKPPIHGSRTNPPSHVAAIALCPWSTFIMLSTPLKELGKHYSNKCKGIIVKNVFLKKIIQIGILY